MTSELANSSDVHTSPSERDFERKAGEPLKGLEVQEKLEEKQAQREQSEREALPPFAMNVELNFVWLILVGLSFGTRMWQLTTPKHVIFDEVHFGQFTNFFMKNQFFYDVNPPLGKLMFALAAYVSGYDGQFSFADIGQDLGEYEQHVWYLRFVSAFLGSLVVPIVYEVIIELGCSHWAAALGGFLATFDNMFVVQSRLVMLDSPLLFFSAASLLCYLKFRKESKRYEYTVMIQHSCSFSFSTKYTGIFTFFAVGFLTGRDLWKLIGDHSLPSRKLARHVISRVACLIVIPSMLYLLQFYILFAVARKTGPHDDMMSSAFQASLEGGLAKITHGQPIEVAYGSQITLRNTFGKQCWLHSHTHTYPVKYPDGRGSSAQQQVTCYGFKDVNNWWIVKDPKIDALSVDFPPRPVRNGDIIQIVHGVTGRALNSHDVAAPLNPANQEVSCYIDYNISMAAQNLWKVEIINPDSSNVWKTIHSQVRLIHVNTSQAVKISGMQLPDWGFHQLEVCTDKSIKQTNTIWNVEEHQQNITYPEGKGPTEVEKKPEPLERAFKPMPFFSKFWEIQLKMLESSKELANEHTFGSRPSWWPLMRRGVAFWIAKDNNAQIFCIGNPFVWWATTLSLPVYFGLLLFYLLRRRRKVYDLSKDSWQQFVFCGEAVVMGYLLHFATFFPLERTLFIHHYLPALFFKIVLLPVMLEHVHQEIFRYKVLRQILYGCCAFLVVIVLWGFHFYSPFTYGHVALSSAEINRRKWLKTWDMLSHPNT
ncbi:protein O-mannosyl-transferase 1-like [Orbicella faveolata]|uniref:protein O-mannosyl-transferase 1-like n=1 Tax=Orbicella faveolata TaxID=48498 RepID=UPI0009E24C09|nr:protein O-mannosyl-transferase 1-like [Orbicella faveolata]